MGSAPPALFPARFVLSVVRSRPIARLAIHFALLYAGGSELSRKRWLELLGRAHQISRSNPANEDRSAVVAPLFEAAAADDFDLELLYAGKSQPHVKLRK